MDKFKSTQYACAVMLVIASICLVSYQVVEIDDVSNGLLFYIGQAFLLVGSIFGLDYYVKLINNKLTHGTDHNSSTDTKLHAGRVSQAHTAS